MTDQETVQFVHQALFRSPPADVSESINEYVADALYAAASRGPWSVPSPNGRPDARWMFSSAVKEWLANNDTVLKQDLAMYVSSSYQPVSPARPAPRRR